MTAASGGDEKLNIRQVAGLAGVSHMTVSRVLNGHPNIRPATRQKVLDVIEAVNYRPSAVARALATRRSQRIGVVIESGVEYGPNSTLRGVEQAARENGYSVSSISISKGASISPHDAVANLSAQEIEALCVIAPRSTSVDLLRELTLGVPTLVIKSGADPNFLTASVDQRRGTTLAVQHLIDLGHREILHLSGPLDWLDARERERAWHACIEAAGLRAGPIVVGDWTSDFGYAFAQSFTGMPEFTAVFAGNDQMALGLVHGFRELGIRVPEDISVVGFDDIPDARHYLPPLTTVQQDFHALGVSAVESLLGAVAGEAPARRSLIAPHLIVRESTAAPRS